MAGMIFLGLVLAGLAGYLYAGVPGKAVKIST